MCVCVLVRWRRRRTHSARLLLCVFDDIRASMTLTLGGEGGRVSARKRWGASIYTDRLDNLLCKLHYIYDRYAWVILLHMYAMRVASVSFRFACFSTHAHTLIARNSHYIYACSSVHTLLASNIIFCMYWQRICACMVVECPCIHASLDFQSSFVETQRCVLSTNVSSIQVAARPHRKVQRVLCHWAFFKIFL